MIGRIGLRRVVPVLLTLIHVALLYFAAEQTVDTVSRLERVRLPPRRLPSRKLSRMGTDGAEISDVRTKTRYFAQSSGNNPRDSNRTGVLSRQQYRVVVWGGAVRAPRVVWHWTVAR